MHAWLSAMYPRSCIAASQCYAAKAGRSFPCGLTAAYSDLEADSAHGAASIGQVSFNTMIKAAVAADKLPSRHACFASEILGVRKALSSAALPARPQTEEYIQEMLSNRLQPTAATYVSLVCGLAMLSSLRHLQYQGSVSSMTTADPNSVNESKPDSAFSHLFRCCLQSRLGC